MLLLFLQLTLINKNTLSLCRIDRDFVKISRFNFIHTHKFFNYIVLSWFSKLIDNMCHLKNSRLLKLAKFSNVISDCLDCYSCANVNSTRYCQNMITCQSNEVRYKSLYEVYSLKLNSARELIGYRLIYNILVCNALTVCIAPV